PCCVCRLESIRSQVLILVNPTLNSGCASRFWEWWWRGGGEARDAIASFPGVIGRGMAGDDARWPGGELVADGEDGGVRRRRIWRWRRRQHRGGRRCQAGAAVGAPGGDGAPRVASDLGGDLGPGLPPAIGAGHRP